MVVCDLDGTLLRSDKSISPRTLEAIESIEGIGIEFAIATARAPRTAFKMLSQKSDKVYMICYNGAEIYKNGKLIYRKYIEAEDVRHIIEWMNEKYLGTNISLEIENILYANFNVNCMKGWDAVYTHVDFKTFIHKPAAKVLLDLSQINDISPIKNMLPDNCVMVVTDKGILGQIMHKDVSKISGVRYITELCKHDINEVVAFGDDYNDIDIITECGIGVAMGNAEEDLKKIANMVTATNDEDGVALVLEEIIDKH